MQPHALFGRIPNSKWCSANGHHKRLEGVKYQAERDGEVEAFNSNYNDPEKAHIALDELEHENTEHLFSEPKDRLGAGPSSSAWARSATQGECSKMPP